MTTQVSSKQTKAMGPPLRKCPLSTKDLTEKIVVFLEKFTSYTLYTYQSLLCHRIISSALENDGSDITALFSRQSGKSESIADLSVSLAIILPVLAREFPDDERLKPFERGFLIGVYAPIEKQADIIFGRMRERASCELAQEFYADEELGVILLKNSGNTITFSNGSRILSRTASPDSSIEGDTHHLIVMEEAQGLLRSKVEKSIMPMGAATNATSIKIGTAGESRGGFHVSIQNNIDAHKKGGKRNHFQIPYDIVIDEKRRAYERDKNPFHLNYEKFIHKEIARLGGTDSDEFKMNFRCLWMESRVIAISPTKFKNGALLKEEMGLSRGRCVVAGLDLGKVTDSTVLATMEIDVGTATTIESTLHDLSEAKVTVHDKVLRDLYELGGSFEGTEGQYERLVSYLNRTTIQILVMDATGLGGDVIFERIQAMVGDRIACVPYKFGTVSKSNLYKYYLQEWNAGRMHYCAGSETKQRMEYGKFEQEHLDLDRVTHGGYAVCQAPDGGHDDYPDACALACWGERMLGEFDMAEIEVVDLSGRGSSYGSVSSSSGGGRGDRYRRRW